MTALRRAGEHLEDAVTAVVIVLAVFGVAGLLVVATPLLLLAEVGRWLVGRARRLRQRFARENGTRVPSGRP